MTITVNINHTADPLLLSALQALAGVVVNSQPAAPAPRGRSRKATDQALTAAEDSVEETALSETVVNAAGDLTPTDSKITLPATTTIEEVRAEVQKVAAGGKKDQVKAALAEFGADKVTNLSKEHYSAFMEKIKAL